MDTIEHFEADKDCGFFRPVGKVSFEEAARLVTRAITFARQQQVPKLLVNVTGLTGFPSPTLAQRYFAVREWAAASKGFLRIAMVIRTEMIDPEKFGVIAGRNAGLRGDVFLAEPEALAWLLSDSRD